MQQKESGILSENQRAMARTNYIARLLNMDSALFDSIPIYTRAASAAPPSLITYHFYFTKKKSTSIAGGSSHAATRAFYYWLRVNALVLLSLAYYCLRPVNGSNKSPSTSSSSSVLNWFWIYFAIIFSFFPTVST